MTLRLPDVDLEHLDAAPLKLALVQARYKPVLAIEQPQRAAEFHEHLGPYEFLGRQVTQNVRVYIGEAEVDQKMQQMPETIWRFQHPDREWTVALSSTSIGFEATVYLDFDDFAAEFERVLEAFSAVFPVPALTRYGMRYINEIADERLVEAQAESLPHFLNPLLIEPVQTLGGKLTSSLSDYRFDESDGTVVLRHGLVAPETYLLDFDYFCDRETEFSHPSIMKLTTEYHDVIERLFVWCLGEGYLGELRSVERGGTTG
jgi:uncharacterized protein (TIGR04255 family)